MAPFQSTAHRDTCLILRRIAVPVLLRDELVADPHGELAALTFDQLGLNAQLACHERGRTGRPFRRAAWHERCYKGGPDARRQVRAQEASIMSRLTVVLFAACLLTAPLGAQWVHHPTPGIPRTADGKPNLTAPVPRTPDGRPDLSGLWQRPADRYYNNIAADLNPKEVQPWADALYQKRVREFGKDSMDTLCLPLGPTYSTSPYHESRIVQTPALIAILNDDLTYRQIFMDGRALEKNPNPSWMGYSVGHWDGGTLVVESVGFNDRTWLDGDGHPHSESLRVTERYHRRDLGHMELQMTLDDPTVYAKPWTVTVQMALVTDLEMIEYVCRENERDRSRMDSKGPELSQTPVAVGTLAKYAGVYEFVDDGGKVHVVEITVSDGTLFWNQDGAGKQKLFAFSENAFSLSGWWIGFIADRQGAVTHFLAQAAEGETKGVRRK